MFLYAKIIQNLIVSLKQLWKMMSSFRDSEYFSEEPVMNEPKNKKSRGAPRLIRQSNRLKRINYFISLM